MTRQGDSSPMASDDQAGAAEGGGAMPAGDMNAPASAPGSAAGAGHGMPPSAMNADEGGAMPAAGMTVDSSSGGMADQPRDLAGMPAGGSMAEMGGGQTQVDWEAPVLSLGGGASSGSAMGPGNAAQAGRGAITGEWELTLSLRGTSGGT